MFLTRVQGGSVSLCLHGLLDQATLFMNVVKNQSTITKTQQGKKRNDKNLMRTTERFQRCEKLAHNLNSNENNSDELLTIELCIE